MKTNVKKWLYNKCCGLDENQGYNIYYRAVKRKQRGGQCGHLAVFASKPQSKPQKQKNGYQFDSRDCLRGGVGGVRTHARLRA